MECVTTYMQRIVNHLDMLQQLLYFRSSGRVCISLTTMAKDLSGNTNRISGPGKAGGSGWRARFGRGFTEPTPADSGLVGHGADDYGHRDRLLKLAQREDALARGIDLIEWTFDPLQRKNAYFNLARLGAIVSSYIPNCYGWTSSLLHAGMPTDRWVAEWWLRSKRMEKRLNGGAIPTAGGDVRISIPVAISEIRKCDPTAAETIQAEFRRKIERDQRSAGSGGI